MEVPYDVVPADSTDGTITLQFSDSERTFEIENVTFDPSPTWDVADNAPDEPGPFNPVAPSYTIPGVGPDQRLVLMTDELAEQLFAYSPYGEQLTIDWGEPDNYGYYSPTIETREHNIDLNDEVLFWTSNDRIFDAVMRTYPREPELATDIARHIIRRLTVPTEEEINAR